MMKKYEISEFKEKLVAEMNAFLKERSCAYQVVIKSVYENGKEKEVVTLESLSMKTSGEIFSVNAFYKLEKLYGYHLKGYSIVEIASSAVEIFRNGMGHKRTITECLNNLTKEDILQNISVRLVPGDVKNQTGFSYARTWNDLSIILEMKLEGIGECVCLVDEMFRSFDLLPNEAFHAAFENVKAEEYKLLDVQTVYECLSQTGLEITEPGCEKMYVYTNADMYYGTKMIFNKEPLRKLAEKLDSDLYFCASSVHEWIIVSEKEVTVSELMAIHKFMQDELKKEERLSDSIYIYRRDYDNIGRVSMMKLKKEV